MALPRSIAFSLALRVLALAVVLLVAVLMAVYGPYPLLAIPLSALAILLTYNLLHYVNDTNRRLARFFESVRYSDFAIRFSSAKEKGGSFEDVNRQFNEVLEAFRQTRAEKEANLLFMN